MSKFFLLLSLVLTGFRDACYSKNSPLALAELEFAQIVRSVLGDRVAVQVKTLGGALLGFQFAGECELIEDRADTYEAIIANIDREKIETSDISLETRFIVLFAAFDLGMKQIEMAMSLQDFQRGEIEADHIHNLPVLVDPTNVSSTEYYIQQETDFYLRRLDEVYGKDEKRKAEELFRETWERIAEIW